MQLVSMPVNTFVESPERAMTSVRQLPVLDQPDVVACCAPLSAEVLG